MSVSRYADRMRSCQRIFVIGAALVMSTGVARADVGPGAASATGTAKVVGVWKVTAASVNGKPVALDAHRHKITFSLFPKGTWAMTVLERRKVRAARGRWRIAPRGVVALSLSTRTGEVDILTVVVPSPSTAEFSWSSVRAGSHGARHSTMRHKALTRFAAKLGVFARDRASIRLTARRATAPRAR